MEKMESTAQLLITSGILPFPITRLESAESFRWEPERLKGLLSATKVRDYIYNRCWFNVPLAALVRDHRTPIRPDPPSATVPTPLSPLGALGLSATTRGSSYGVPELGVVDF